MKRKQIFIISIIAIVALSLLACQKIKKAEKREGLSRIETNNISYSGNYEISDVKYFKDGIEAYYPQITAGDIEEKMLLWNEIIKKDFNKIIQIYSFQPFPELEPTPTHKEDMVVLLFMDYITKVKDENFLSIYYTARYSSKYSAHPSELVYTTNIDLDRDKKVLLKDIVTINQDFINSFRQWKFKTYEEDNMELNEAIEVYFEGLSDEELLQGFMNADQISANNTWGVYSYITPDKLGISISVPHVIGDHVEFESEFEDIAEFLSDNFIFIPN